MPKPPVEPMWLTGPQVAERLGVSLRTFYRHYRYELPYRQEVEGGSVRFHVHDVDALAVRRLRQPVS